MISCYIHGPDEVHGLTIDLVGVPRKGEAVSIGRRTSIIAAPEYRQYRVTDVHWFAPGTVTLYLVPAEEWK